MAALALALVVFYGLFARSGSRCALAWLAEFRARRRA
jgi:hypothetical protein